MSSRRELSLYLFGLLMLLAVVFRTPSSQAWAFHPVQISWLLGLFLALYLTEFPLTRRWPQYLPFYLILQTALIAGLLLVPPSLDFFAILFVLLSIQTMRVYEPRIGFSWIAVFILVAAACLIYDLGPAGALGLVFVYGAPCLFTGAFVLSIRQSEEAKARSEDLLLELQEAHQKLQEYAAQVDELATVRERNRLARDLHDSVTQTIFSLRLNIESSQMLLEGDSAQLSDQLERLKGLAGDALAEMRRLIFELRPEEIEQGLHQALNHQVVKLKEHSGLLVDLQITGKNALSPDQELLVFRIVQEALNNVVKHARTDHALLTLDYQDGRLYLEVSDKGRGFEPGARSLGQPHLGLESMQERANALGGRLEIDARPGKGTRVTVEFPLDSRKSDDG